MQVLTVDIDAVKPYEKNPRQNRQSIDIVAQSLKEYGFQQPIVVDRDYCIIVGHTRHLAAKKLGFTEVPIVVADNLTDSQVRAYRIADNKTNEYSQWDQSLLTEELDQLMSQYDINSVSALTGMRVMEVGDLVFDELYHKNYIIHSSIIQKVLPSTTRIAILASRSFVQKHNGKTTYVAGWLEWAKRNHCYVDIIADFPPTEIKHNHFEKYQGIFRWIFSEYAAEKPSSNSLGQELNLDTDLYLKYGNNPALDSSSRLRVSLLQALSQHCYNAIIVNGADELLSLLSTGLHCEFDKVYYVTHGNAELGRYFNLSRYSFKDSNWRIRILYNLLKAGDIKVLTPTPETLDDFVKASNYDSDKAFYCPLHISESELQEFSESSDRKGILWIGRWESIKDPELYIKLCKESGLPALLVAPSATSARKFKKRFLEEGIEHEIHVGLSGPNKINVIKTAAVAVQTSFDETFCYAAFEAAHCCPLVLPKERVWTQVHRNWATIVPIAEMSDTIKKLYGKPVSEQTKKALKDFVQEADNITAKLTEKSIIDVPFKNALTKWLEKVGEGTLEDFCKTRPRIIFDEVFYALKLQFHPDYEEEHGLDYTLFRYKKFDPAKAQKVLSYKKK